MSDIRKSYEDKSLAELAQMIRESMDHARTAWSNALGHVLDVGDALNAAQEQVANKQVTNWKKWLRDNCFLSVSTAQLYQQLARHRDEIEAEVERTGVELGVRAARRLISKSKPRNPKKTKTSGSLTAPDKETDAESTAALVQEPVIKRTNAEWTADLKRLGFERFLLVIPPEFIPRLQDRLINLLHNRDAADAALAEAAADKTNSAMQPSRKPEVPGARDQISLSDAVAAALPEDKPRAKTEDAPADAPLAGNDCGPMPACLVRRAPAVTPSPAPASPLAAELSFDSEQLGKLNDEIHELQCAATQRHLEPRELRRLEHLHKKCNALRRPESLAHYLDRQASLG